MATYWLMRMLAWWKKKRSISFGSVFVAQQASISARHIFSTACLNTVRPSIWAHMWLGCTWPTPCSSSGMKGRLRMSQTFWQRVVGEAAVGAEPRARTPRFSSVALTTTAPAPSPKSVLTVRPLVEKIHRGRVRLAAHHEDVLGLAGLHEAAAT